MVVKFDIRVEGQRNVSTSSSMWNGELHLDGWVLVGCKIVIKFVFKEKALRSLLANTHVLCC